MCKLGRENSVDKSCSDTVDSRRLPEVRLSPWPPERWGSSTVKRASAYQKVKVFLTGGEQKDARAGGTLVVSVFCVPGQAFQAEGQERRRG